MATKSRNDWALVWSIVSIVIALASIAYCYPHIIQIVSDSVERADRTIAYFAKIMKGSTSL